MCDIAIKRCLKNIYNYTNKINNLLVLEKYVMNKEKESSNQFWVVIICLVFLILVIFSVNKSLFFPEKEVASNIVLGEKSNQAYKITVYYFPAKKSEAKALTFFFKEHGYNVDMQIAATIPALKGSKNSPSHIFFNHGDLDKAMKIKSLIEQVIGHSVNAYQFHEPQTNPSMMMVFTEKEL
ncbi:MAG: hypothetical protein ACI9ES_002440 [Oceanospirillaceae bacterium]|jgi:hypothetical protein